MQLLTLKAKALKLKFKLANSKGLSGIQTTITHNVAKNGIEIKFADKPSDKDLEFLKSKKFRWSRFGKLWYATYSMALMEEVTALFETGATESESGEKRQSKGDKALLPLAQHIKAYSFMKLDDKDKRQEVVKESFVDGDQNIYIKSTGYYLRSWDEKEQRKFINWTKISPSGSAGSYTPDSTYKPDPVFQFEKGIYGVPVKDVGEPGKWYAPASKEGKKYMTNGKVVAVNVKTLEDAGYEVKSLSSYGRFRVSFKAKEGQEPKALKNDADIAGELQPITIPNRVFVPENKRPPHYKLPKVTEYKDRVKVRRDVLENEILLGKMEIALHRYFDGMADMYEYVGRKDLHWVHSTEIPHISYHETPRHIGENEVEFGNYYLRYTGKPAPKYIDLNKGTESRQEPEIREPEADRARIAFLKLRARALQLKFKLSQKKT